MDSLAECVLLVECNSTDEQLVSRSLLSTSAGKFQIECAVTTCAALERIRKGGVQAVILCMYAPVDHGLACFARIVAAAPHLSILILTDHENEAVARQAANSGSHDYILTDNLHEFRLRRIVYGMIERKAHEEAVFLERQCAEVALACTGDAVLIVDRSGHITHLNAAAELMTGWSRQEAMGRLTVELFHMEDSEKRSLDIPSLHLPRDDKKSRPGGNYTLRRHDGTEVLVEMSTGASATSFKKSPAPYWFFTM